MNLLGGGGHDSADNTNKHKKPWDVSREYRSQLDSHGPDMGNFSMKINNDDNGL